MATAAEEASSEVADRVQDDKGSTRTDDSLTDLADFGANEWLVDEMYERYQ
ncbi:MAG: hypothetical protein QOK15_1613, partial [Nocardioidaceae bacterium]|nr:hypothetical protein [Nocardioidaceae bacterium]